MLGPLALSLFLIPAAQAADTDGDGIPDGLEDTNFDGDLTNDDADGDGIPNYLDTDDDDDTLRSFDEVNFWGTNPYDPDTDADGLSDGQEVLVHGTDPLSADTDGGGVVDGTEVLDHGTNPLDPSDDAGLSAPSPGVAGVANTVTLSVGATPGATVGLVGGLSVGSTPVPGCPSLTIQIAAPMVVATAVADADGRVDWTVDVPAALAGATVHYTAVQPAGCLAFGQETATF